MGVFMSNRTSFSSSYEEYDSNDNCNDDKDNDNDSDELEMGYTVGTLDSFSFFLKATTRQRYRSDNADTT